MDYTNERWVKLYVRATVTWHTWPWEAQALFPQLLRVVDRAGVLDVGDHDPVDALSAYLPRWPREVLEVGLAGLCKTGTVELEGERALMPRFLAAQEAKTSDAQRSRSYRSRRKAKGDGSSAAPQLALPGTILPSETASERVTERDATITGSDGQSRFDLSTSLVSSGSSVNSPGGVGEPDPGAGRWADAECVVRLIVEARRRLGVKSTMRAVTERQATRVRRPFNTRGPLTDEQMQEWRMVIDRAEASCRKHPTTAHGKPTKDFLTLSTLSRPDNFDRYVERDELEGDVDEQRARDRAEAEQRRREDKQRGERKRAEDSVSALTTRMLAKVGTGGATP